MFSLIGELGKLVISGITGAVKRKQALKAAETEGRIELLKSKQSHNQMWEMRALQNVGWKDDVLFYAMIGGFIWAGYDPDAARLFFENLKVLPEWYINIFGAVVASVVGIRKLADYGPSLVKGIKEAWKG